VSINLPRPPDQNLFSSDNPRRYLEELTNWATRVIAELERESREQSAPAHAVISVKNIAAPTTALDGATATLGDLTNFLGGLVDTLNKRGFIRTRAGQE